MKEGGGSEDTSVAFATDGSSHYKLNMVSIKGPCLNPGTNPNVTGECGDGFVMGISEEVEYNVWFNGAILMRVNDEPHLQIREKMRSKFLEYLRCEN